MLLVSEVLLDLFPTETEFALLDLADGECLQNLVDVLLVSRLASPTQIINMGDQDSLDVSIKCDGIHCWGKLVRHESILFYHRRESLPELSSRILCPIDGYTC